MYPSTLHRRTKSCRRGIRIGVRSMKSLENILRFPFAQTERSAKSHERLVWSVERDPQYFRDSPGRGVAETTGAVVALTSTRPTQAPPPGPIPSVAQTLAEQAGKRDLRRIPPPVFSGNFNKGRRSFWHVIACMTSVVLPDCLAEYVFSGLGRVLPSPGQKTPVMFKP